MTEIKELSEFSHIKTVGDAKDLIRTLVSSELGMAFNPDYSFDEYTYESDDSQVFSDEEVKRLNGLMGEAVEVCEKNNTDIYKITLDIMQSIYGQN